MKPTDKLIVATDKVAISAAGNWDEFLAAFRAFKDEQLELMAKASPDKVHVLQGRAQCAIELLDKFESCHEKAKLIVEMVNAKR